MEKEYIIIIMEINMKVNVKMIKKMVKEYFIVMIEINIQVNGKMI